MAEGKQLFAELDVIIDLAVEDDGVAAVRAPHRLLAAANVDDRQAAMTEPDLEASAGGVEQLVAGAVRSAMGHEIGETGKRLAVLAIGGTEGPTEDPAHPNQSFPLPRNTMPDRGHDTRTKGVSRHPQGDIGSGIRSDL